MSRNICIHGRMQGFTGVETRADRARIEPRSHLGGHGSLAKPTEPRAPIKGRTSVGREVGRIETALKSSVHEPAAVHRHPPRSTAG